MQYIDLKYEVFNGIKEDIPLKLLLLADPSLENIEKYCYESKLFVAVRDNEIIGILALILNQENTYEIKNISVKKRFQGKGVGTKLIKLAEGFVGDKNGRYILIRTANSSVSQLCLYQFLGFEIFSVDYNFYIQNYRDLIFENNIQAKHRINLRKELLII